MSTINFNGLQSLEKEGNKMQNSHKLSMMTMTALFAAMISVLAQIVIPLPLIPMTGQTFAIGLAGTILGSRHGLSATVLYVLMGCIGIPVFAQMTGGLGILFGPTGGFIIGFIPATWLIGYYLEKTSFTFVQACIANFIGMVVTLAFGMIWLKFSANLSWTAAFVSSVAPFIVAGIVKAILAAWIGIIIRNRLATANMLPHAPSS